MFGVRQQHRGLLTQNHLFVSGKIKQDFPETAGIKGFVKFSRLHMNVLEFIVSRQGDCFEQKALDAALTVRKLSSY